MLANINREQVHHHIPDLEAKIVLSSPIAAHQQQNSRMNPMLLTLTAPVKEEEPKSPQPSSLLPESSGPAEDEEMSDPVNNEEDHDMDVKKD